MAYPVYGSASRETSGTFRIVVREGQILEGKVVKAVVTLESSSGTPAEDRWRIDGDHLGIRVRFEDGTTACYSVSAHSDDSSTWIKWTSPATDASYSAELGKLPAFGPSGTVQKVSLSPRTKGTGKKHSEYFFEDHEGNIRVTNASLDYLSSPRLPLMGSDTFAFPAGGKLSANPKASFSQNPPSSLVFVTRSEIQPENTTEPKLLFCALRNLRAPGGGLYETIGSTVFPNGPSAGAIYIGNLQEHAFEAVTASNKRGLWRTDSTGRSKLLIRAGIALKINGRDRIVAKFSALKTVPGSAGAGAGFSADGTVAVTVFLTDGTQSLIRILP